MTLTPSQPGSSKPDLGQLLRQVRHTCPKPERPLNADFLTLWKSRIDRAYSASRWDLLEVLVLNREVESLARGPEGEGYARAARLNTVRLLARMGEKSRIPNHAIQEMATREPDEHRWLLWLLKRVADRGDGETLDDWHPTAEPGRTLRQGCALLDKGVKAEAVRLAEYARARPGPREENTPLGTLRHQIRLEMARAHLARRELREARTMAARVGVGLEPEARRIQIQAELDLGILKPDQRRTCAGEARFAAYRALRRAKLHSTLAYHGAANRWRVEVDAWKTLRGQLCGEIES